VAVQQGPTPHSLRHGYRTMMLELGTPPVLMDAQMGHRDGSIGARYSHVTPAMVTRLTTDLSEVWSAALNARRTLAPGSPVAALDRLLRKTR
jgi:integrase